MKKKGRIGRLSKRKFTNKSCMYSTQEAGKS